MAGTGHGKATAKPPTKAGSTLSKASSAAKPAVDRGPAVVKSTKQPHHLSSGTCIFHFLPDAALGWLPVSVEYL